MSTRSERWLAEAVQRAQKDPGLPIENPTVSYWQLPELDSVATVQSPKLPQETDILVIGSGISGCSISRHLLEGDQNLRVTVLEARKVTSGATGRNGGHIKAVPEYSYPELVPSLGKEGAKEVVRFTLANVEALLKVVRTLSPELRKYCEVREVEALNLFTEDEAVTEFVEGLKEFEKENVRRGRMVSKEELKSKFDVHNAAGAYLCPAGAGWPYRLITGLFAEMLKSNKDRFTIEALTPALSISYQQDTPFPYSVETSRGSIRANQIIHATNGHAGHLLPKLRGAIYPVRGQMTAQAPTKRFGIQGATRSWSTHYGNGFDYMTQSGNSGEIFLGGGLAQADQRGMAELANVRDDQISTLAAAHLSGITNSVWASKPEEDAVSHVLAKWTGVMGFTGDFNPLIGRLPFDTTGREGNGEWISAGFNGYGMANAWLCGKHVADRILQKEDDGVLPRSYVATAERLRSMNSEDAIRTWMVNMGID